MDITLICIAVIAVVFVLLGFYVSEVGAPSAEYHSNEAVKEAFASEWENINAILQLYGYAFSDEYDVKCDEFEAVVDWTLHLDGRTDLRIILSAHNRHSLSDPLYEAPRYGVYVTRITDTAPQMFTLCEEYPFVYDVVALLEGGRCKADTLKACGDKLISLHTASIQEYMADNEGVSAYDSVAYSGLLFKQGNMSIDTEQETSEAVYDKEKEEYVLETYDCKQCWDFFNYWYNAR